MNIKINPNDVTPNSAAKFPFFPNGSGEMALTDVDGLSDVIGGGSGTQPTLEQVFGNSTTPPTYDTNAAAFAALGAKKPYLTTAGLLGFTFDPGGGPVPGDGPELMSAAISNANKDKLTLVYSEPLNTSSIPVASDFTVAGTNVFIKGNFPAAVSATTSVSLHANASSDGTPPHIINPKFPAPNPNFGATGTGEYTVQNVNHQSRIRLAGNAFRVKFYLDSIPTALTAFRIQIWRDGTPAAIFTQDVFSQLAVGLNTIDLTTPIAVRVNDRIGIWYTTTGSVSNFMTAHVASTDERDGAWVYPRAGSGPQSFNNTNWTHISLYFPVEVFVDKGADVVLFGDSRIEGYSYYAGLSFDYYTEAITDTLSFKLGNKLNVRTANMGRSGNNSADMLFRFQADAIDMHPKYIIINGTQNGTTIQDYSDMLDLANAANIQVILLAIMPFASYGPTIDTVNTQLQNLAATKGAWFLNLKQVIGDPSNSYQTILPIYQGDGNHQNGLGNEAIADAIVGLFRTKLPVTINGDTITLQASGNFSYTDQVTVDITGTRIKNANGDSAININDQAVTNNVQQEPEPIIFSGGGFVEVSPQQWGGPYGRGTKKLSSGQTGRIWTHHITAGTVIAFAKSATALNPSSDDWSNLDYGYLAQGSDLYRLQSSNPVDNFGPAVNGRYYGVYRDGQTGSVKLQYSDDAVNWVDILTYSTTHTGDLYVFSKSAASEPTGFNLDPFTP